MPSIIIDKDKCKACGICINVCPKKIIKMSECTNATGSCYAIFDNSKNDCSGCALCAISCPDIAIKEVYR